MRYIGHVREDEAEKWARAELKLPRSPDFFRAVSAIDQNGDFVCVVVLTNFTARNVDLNVVMSCKKIRPKGLVLMFNELFSLIFKRLGIKRATGLVRASNERSKKMIERFGFKLEGVMRKAFENDEDLYVYGLLAEEFEQHSWCRG